MSSHRLHQQTSATATFVEIMGELVNDFDVIDVLTVLTARCVELLPAAAAGILLADTSEHLRVVGASNETVQLLELLQLQSERGPCLDCYHSGEAVAAPDLRNASTWPEFAAASVGAGYPAVYAIPLHRNAVRLGCLNLFMSHPGELAPADVALAQALAVVASIAIVQSRSNLQSEDRDAQLRHALEGRVAVEQAKGMLAEQFTLDVRDAFELLRSHARDTGLGLVATAEQLVASTLTVDAFAGRRAPGLGELVVQTTIAGGRRTVRFTGELELGTRVACFNACVNGEGDDVEVDISALAFMDCSGYGALVAARLVIEQRGGTLTVGTGTGTGTGTGEPEHLLELIARLEHA
ncbi:MAG: GAF and ANTAR domain-containing protein [Actinobacteria bacterium]|nr:GAF and ANTAR domain-containing protein [Actinomycetota bacterium]